VSFVGSSLGIIIGNIVNDLKALPIVVTLFLMPLETFSGFYKNRNDLPAWSSWIENISPLKYSFIALVYNETENRSSLVAHLNFDLST
jgi:hypothetical protein